MTWVWWFVRAHWNRIVAVILLAIAGWLYYEQHRPHPNAVITVLHCVNKTPPSVDGRGVLVGSGCDAGIRYRQIAWYVHQRSESQRSSNSTLVSLSSSSPRSDLAIRISSSTSSLLM